MSDRTARLLAVARRRVDAVMAAVLTVSAVLLGIPDWGGSAWVVFDSACMVAVCVLVAWRRRYPIVVAIIAAVLLLVLFFNVGGETVGNDAVSDPAGAATFLLALALGSERRWARSLLGLVPLTAGLVIPAGQFNPFLLTVTIGPWLVGLTLSSRQRAADQLERRIRELAEEREMFAAASVRYERSRIARELHDIVAHSVSLMVVQANAGAYLAGTDPHAAAEAFDAIGETAAQARTEIDRLAGLFDADAPLDLVGLDLVDDLIDHARTAGLHITYELSGPVDHLSVVTTGTIHRVIQEAITNALKHAPGSPITIGLRGDSEVVAMVIGNAAPLGRAPGPAALRTSGGGNGLAGMRERVHQNGGEFRAGPDGAGGWRVEAWLPRPERTTAGPARFGPAPVEPAPVEPSPSLYAP